MPRDKNKKADRFMFVWGRFSVSKVIAIRYFRSFLIILTIADDCLRPAIGGGGKFGKSISKEKKDINVNRYIKMISYKYICLEFEWFIEMPLQLKNIFNNIIQHVRFWIGFRFQLLLHFSLEHIILRHRIMNLLGKRFHSSRMVFSPWPTST